MIEGQLSAIETRAHNPAAFSPTCKQCGGPFAPRNRSGGRPQIFCGADCRSKFYSAGSNSPKLAANVGNLPNVGKLEAIAGKNSAAAGVEISAAVMPAPAGAAPPLATVSIPHQAPVKIRGLAGGGVEIAQEGQFGVGGDDEEDLIHVSPAYAVKLARGILEAAGFQGVAITCGRYNQDVEDGQTADQFDFSQPEPPAPRPLLAPKAPEPEPDPPFDWDGTAVCDTQLQTAVYETVGHCLGIRQQPFDIHDADDLVIVITRPHIQSFIDRVKSVGDAILNGGGQ